MDKIKVLNISLIILILIELLSKINFMIKPKSANFGFNEFRSKDKDGNIQVPVKYWRNVQILMKDLEVIRKVLGDYPIIINSAYRTAKHNKAVDGSPNSQHLEAKAVDIYMNKVHAGILYSTICDMMKAGKISKGAVIYYPKKNFVHFDIRGVQKHWIQN